LKIEDGLLLLDKPIGPTSHDVVQHVRRVLGLRRVGHAGTLDPPASGLLPIVLGRATRLVRFLPDGPKCYVGALRLGVTSLTDDASAPPRARFDGPLPSPSMVVTAAAKLEGAQLQVPPAISARRVGGERLYRLNRTAPIVEGPARPVVVSQFRVYGSGTSDVYDLEAVVSAGTYVRALVRDLGALLGCGAVLIALRRTAIGPFRVENAITPPGSADPEAASVLGASILPVDRIPLWPQDYRIEQSTDERRFVSGMAVDAADGGGPPGIRSVSAADGRRVGIGTLGGGRLRPLIVLVPPADVVDQGG